MSIKRSTTYPWLSMEDREDGSVVIGVDAADATPAEVQRRTAIAQELRAGRIFLAEEVRPLYQQARHLSHEVEYLVSGEESGAEDAVIDAFPAPEDWKS